MVEKMNTSLITDGKDPKWVLLGKIIGIVSSRRVKQEMAKQGISPVNLAGTMFVLIAIFFSVDISYVISELLKRAELRRFAKLVEIPEAKVPILGKIRREKNHWACSRRFGLDMCQKGKKQGVLSLIHI